MAEIFRGKATAGGGFEKPVAIKRILPHLSQDKRFVELLITEAKTLSQLRHRNVVQIYDVGLGDDGQYFLVMEYVDGLDLGHLYESLEKRSRRLPLDVALYITGEVCEALEHAHQARGDDGQPLGLVHRDVSPSNVLLSRSGEVKLTDFGIAKRTEEATGHGGVRGKFAYISPEQAHNRRVDARSDVYSAAILVFELVTGHRLFSDLPDFDALRAVREGRLPSPRDIDPGIDAELERIVLTGLAPRPEDRFPSAGNLGAAAAQLPLLDRVDGGRSGRRGRAPDRRARRQQTELPAPPAREPSVVRISTVAGFSGSIEVPELHDEPTGTITGEIGLSPPPLGLDEEETRAVNLSSVAARLGGMPRRHRALQGSPQPAARSAPTSRPWPRPRPGSSTITRSCSPSSPAPPVTSAPPSTRCRTPSPRGRTNRRSRAARRGRRMRAPPRRLLRQAFYNGVMNEPRPPAAAPGRADPGLAAHGRAPPHAASGLRRRGRPRGACRS